MSSKDSINHQSINHLRKVVQTSLFIALALVTRSFSYMVYIGGATGMRISFSGVFTRITAILFGPLYGGAASGIVDIIGYLLKPEGAYIPLLTITAVLGGVITGLLWRNVKNIDSKKMQISFLGLFIVIGVIGIINHIYIIFKPYSHWAQMLQKIGKYENFATIGLEIVSLLGLLLFSIDFIISKKHKEMQAHDTFLKILTAVGLSGIIVTTLNTFILQLFIPNLGKISFMIFWIPRLIQEIFMSVVQAYVISFLLAIYKRYVPQHGNKLV